MRLIAATTIMTVTLALAACSGDGDATEPPPPPEVKAGQCFAEEIPDGNDTAPDFESEVPCTDPHVFEVLTVIDIADKFLTGTTKEQQLANRTALADVSEDPDEQTVAMRRDTYPTCGPAFSEATGLSKLTIGGKDAKQSGLGASIIGGSTWFNVTSPEQWIAGDKSLVCSIRFADRSNDEGDTGKVIPVTSPDKAPLITHYLDGEDWPVEFRRCIGPNNQDSVDCDKPHRQEVLFNLNLRGVYGTDFVKGEDLKNLDESDLGKIKSACEEIYRQAGYTPPDELSFGFRYFGGKDASTSEDLIASCVLEKSGGDLINEYSAFQKG